VNPQVFLVPDCTPCRIYTYAHVSYIRDGEMHQATIRVPTARDLAGFSREISREDPKDAKIGESVTTERV